MGIGDQLLALGDAWKAHRTDPRQRPVAIGDGRRLAPVTAGLDWGLSFLATPQDLASGRDLQWLAHHKENRPYIDYQAMRKQACELETARLARRPLGRWTAQVWQPLLRRRIANADLKRLLQATGHYLWRYDHPAEPAPLVFKPEELAHAEAIARAGPFVVIEPSIKAEAPPSKQWPIERYRDVARALSADIRILQMSAAEAPTLDAAVERLAPTTFRQALAILGRARLYIGPEGGLHHGCAAVGTAAIVIFGGFIAPAVTGYPSQLSLTGDAPYACGTRYGFCPHCRAAMDRIGVAEVLDHARRLIG